MPRSGQVRAPSGERLSDRVALGVLTATFPRRLIDEVVEATGRREQRSRLLPARVTVYYVLAMTLFSSAGYQEVMRSLTEGLTWSSDPNPRVGRFGRRVSGHGQISAVFGLSGVEICRTVAPGWTEAPVRLRNSSARVWSRNWRSCQPGRGSLCRAGRTVVSRFGPGGIRR